MTIGLFKRRRRWRASSATDDGIKSRPLTSVHDARAFLVNALGAHPRLDDALDLGGELVDGALRRSREEIGGVQVTLTVQIAPRTVRIEARPNAGLGVLFADAAADGSLDVGRRPARWGYSREIDGYDCTWFEVQT